ncbi:ATP-binding cassette domain-containing protein [uncultured Nocardioides sp.]|uniref:ABC transporter ATP-binding protein n=1 Tax=uncultured Nocardioides sp. TaxID=198441 RepID=UPI00261A4A12|nr:ATP-binding cassette domain-containing protein [uncultured Nocardioides sp.]
MPLTAAQLTFGYGERSLFRDLSLRVDRTDSVAIVGPSGSGKTTLLGLLGGLIRPQFGVVTIDEPGFTHVQAGVSWVLQTMNVLPHRSVVDNVALGALSEGLDYVSARERAHEAIERLGIRHRAYRPIRELSGGEVQRTVIARALVSGRPFILADEPTGQLDRDNTELVVQALLRTRSDEQGERRGLVIVTHDPAVAERCATQLTVTDGGLSPA